MDTIKEYPILFSAPMVRAILDGRKTQSRRIIKCNCNGLHLGRLLGEWGLSIPPHQWDGNADDVNWDWHGRRPPQIGDWVEQWQTDVDDHACGPVPCPYGKPGHRLWVRESYWCGLLTRSYPNGDYESYWSGNVQYDDERSSAGPLTTPYVGGVPWMDRRPSIHMPRRHSRITLEITGVRVERLQEISEEDAIAEGAPLSDNPDYDPDDPGDDQPQTHVAGFMDIWESINGPDSLAANPWVWCVEWPRFVSGGET